MQTRAVIEAALNVRTLGIHVKAEIMVPLVGTVREFNAQADVIRRTAATVFAERGETLDYLLGTMIETPFIVETNIGFNDCTFCFPCQLWTPWGGILNIKQLLRKSPEIMNGLRLFHGGNKGAAGFPMR